MTNTINAARRRFLQISLTASGALLVGWRSADAVAPMQSSELLGDDVTALTDFVMIERDNRVVIGARGCEVGQGVLTSLPMLIAEELGVNWSQVRVVQLPYGYTASGNRYGSQDPREPMANTWIYLRQAGAQARALMLRAAAAEWRVDVEQLRSEAGQVLAPDGRKLSYGALARSAAALPASTAAVRLKDDIDFNIIGHDIPVADGNELVTGQ
ncbi:MAG: molybdopterin cofactor-binding domain-containing protein, partial [Dokdonella sp.]